MRALRKPHTEGREYVTLCDYRFLPKALALHASLLDHCTDFRLSIVALDEECHRTLRQLTLPSVSVIGLGDIEAEFPDLLVAKCNRSQVEYYYTLSPAVCRYTLARVSEEDILTYLDADMFFFASPGRVFDALDGASIGITPHRHSRSWYQARKTGEFNVGWVSFRNDDNGRACLAWWYERCVEWCYQRCESGKYADQGYLDEFPNRFAGVRVLDDPGVNLAPWNLARYRVTQSGGRVLVDGVPLVCFHFAECEQVSRWHYSTNSAATFVWLTPTLRRALFHPYVAMLRKVAPMGLPTSLRRASVKDLLSRRGPRMIVKSLRNIMMMQYVFVFGEHYF